MKKIISVTGYFGTGSSAVIDYLKEFNNIEHIDTEFHLLMTNGGLDELNYKFSLGNAYLIGLAVERFYRCAKILSRFGIYGVALDSPKLWDGYFFERTEDFIKKFSYGYKSINSPFNLVDERKNLNRFNMVILPRIKRIFYKYILQRKNVLTEDFNCPKDKIYFIKNYDEFKKLQKEYIHDLLEKIGEKKKEKEYLVFDHLLPVSLLDKEKLYFEEIKAIVVDRDPRDIYILNIEKWKEKFVPIKIDEYVDWYKLHRIKKDNNNILKVRFEDLIYKNEEITDKIKKFIGIDEKNHQSIKKYFDIDISIKNTQLFKKYKKYNKEIQYIEKELKEYCYDFPNIDVKEGEIF